MAKGKKRLAELPEYGTVMMKGVQYYRTRITDADGKRVRLTGNGSRQSQSMRSCAAVSWRMRQISVPKIWKNVGSGRKTGLKTASWNRVWIRW